MDDPEAYALAAWRSIEHAWRTEGTLAALAGGFQPLGSPNAPRLVVADTGRLDRAEQVRAVRAGDVVRLSAPLAVLDVWIDMDDLAEALVEAIAQAVRRAACDDLDYS